MRMYYTIREIHKYAAHKLGGHVDYFYVDKMSKLRSLPWEKK